MIVLHLFNFYYKIKSFEPLCLPLKKCCWKSSIFPATQRRDILGHIPISLKSSSSPKQSSSSGTLATAWAVQKIIRNRIRSDVKEQKKEENFFWILREWREIGLSKICFSPLQKMSQGTRQKNCRKILIRDKTLPTFFPANLDWIWFIDNLCPDSSSRHFASHFYLLGNVRFFSIS